MRYIYFAYGLMTVNVLTEESTEHGELIGTSTAWHRATKQSKKFIIASLLANSEYKDVKGIVINDCDAPKPTPTEDPGEQPNG